MKPSKMVERTCIQCGDSVKGRIDKKFCSDDCRVSWHNYQNRDISKFMTNINKILRKNRRILDELHNIGKTKVTKAQLLDEGFRFAYHTNEFKTKAGKTYYFIYDQGYLEYEPGFFALVVKHEYVE